MANRRHNGVVRTAIGERRAIRKTHEKRRTGEIKEGIWRGEQRAKGNRPEERNIG